MPMNHRQTIEQVKRDAEKITLKRWQEDEEERQIRRADQQAQRDGVKSDSADHVDEHVDVNQPSQTDGPTAEEIEAQNKPKK